MSALVCCVGMSGKKRKSPAEALLKADKAAHDAAKPYRETAPIEALSWYSKLGDQPQMLSLSGGVLALGLARGDRRMARAGVRMIAAHLLATGAKNFVKRRGKEMGGDHANACPCHPAVAASEAQGEYAA
jgi:hypothetical protein